MPKYIALRGMNTSSGHIDKGTEIERSRFDTQKLGQLIRVGWIAEMIDESDPNDKREFPASTLDASTLELIRRETRTRNIPSIKSLEAEETSEEGLQTGGIVVDENPVPVIPPEEPEITGEVVPQDEEPAEVENPIVEENPPTEPVETTAVEETTTTRRGRTRSETSSQE